MVGSTCVGTFEFRGVVLPSTAEIDSRTNYLVVVSSLTPRGHNDKVLGSFPTFHFVTPNFLVNQALSSLSDTVDTRVRCESAIIHECGVARAR